MILTQTVRYTGFEMIKTLLILSRLSGHDLALLTMANYSVLSYGTFGLWGALLANPKEIIVSKNMMTETKEGYELSQAKLPYVTTLS